MTPQIPAMPTPPQPDPGAGPHNSQPANERDDDIEFFAVARGIYYGALAIGYKNAARGLNNYLKNKGEDLSIDPDDVMNSVPGLRRHAERLVVEAVSTSARANPTSPNPPITFTTAWSGYYILQSEHSDWFYAMGGISVCATGVVTITHTGSGSDRPEILLDYRIHIFDRYNWDKKKKVTIAGKTVTDEKMGGLHTAGLAMEFNQFGSSTVKHFKGPLPDEIKIDGRPSWPR
ncbi:hypothetical protein FEK33_12420 [Nocardia asteroides NBRC 15531]|nr:hypothetical protein [Nocardia asteroides]TLF66829.1 hypothetical protein FEK33_12420 [Nocardia asteroides NBRC 15531]UGT51926.1 hypothetical protein LT345_15785 [Nocardia asteroides]